MRYHILFLFWVVHCAAWAQVLTKEDSLNAGLVKQDRTTLVSGYGELKVAYDQRLGTGNASITRNVLFVGHRFNNRISFFSEMELENAGVDDGSLSGEPTANTRAAGVMLGQTH